MTENKEYNPFDSTNLLMFILQWKKQLMIVGVLAAVISSAVALMIQPKFKSTVIMFPASTSSLSKALISENVTGKHDILSFGEEEEAEQMLQILNSDEIRQRVIDKYDLLKHYEFEEGEEYVKTKLLKKYEDNISFKRTEYQSVQVDVLDKDPQIAANMANDIAALLDTVRNRMQKERSIKGFKIVEREYNDIHTYIRSLEDSMTVLRKLGVHEYEVQIEMFTEQYSKALAEGKTSAAKSLEEKLAILAEYGSAYVSLRNKLEYETERMIDLRAKYKEAKVDAEEELPHKFIVNRAFPAEKKSYPIRWLIVVVSVVSSLMFSVIVIITMENIKQIQNAKSNA